MMESALELGESHHVLRGMADMHVALCEVLLERNDLDGARRHLDANAQLGEQAGLPQDARVPLARDSPPPPGRRGCDTGARPARGSRTRLQHGHVAAGATSHRRRVRALLAGGNLAAAEQEWADATGLAPNDELAYVREYEHITLAHVLLADGAATTQRNCCDASSLLPNRASGTEASSRSLSCFRSPKLQRRPNVGIGDVGRHARPSRTRGHGPRLPGRLARARTTPAAPPQRRARATISPSGCWRRPNPRLGSTHRHRATPSSNR